MHPVLGVCDLPRASNPTFLSLPTCCLFSLLWQIWRMLPLLRHRYEFPPLWWFCFCFVFGFFGSVALGDNPIKKFFERFQWFNFTHPSSISPLPSPPLHPPFFLLPPPSRLPAFPPGTCGAIASEGDSDDMMIICCLTCVLMVAAPVGVGILAGTSGKSFVLAVIDPLDIPSAGNASAAANATFTAAPGRGGMDGWVVGWMLLAGERARCLF